jgi:hypothetical protein
MRTPLIRLAVLSLALTSGLVAQNVVGRSEETYTIREQMSSGDKLRLTSPNGTIAIAQGSGSAIEIRGEKRTQRNSRIEEVGFIVKRTADGLVVCAVYDDDDECDMERGYRSENRRSWNGPRTRVNFTVVMPAGLRVNAATGNGDVTINGAGSEVDAATGNGSVLVSNTMGRVNVSTGNGRVIVEAARGEVEVNTGNGDVKVVTSSGPVRARSGNGNIDVSMARVDRGERMTFSTGSGRIVVAVPEGFGADLEATTGNGEIASEIPVRVEGRISPYRMRGVLGNGGERLSLSTGNGDIQIRKAMRE